MKRLFQNVLILTLTMAAGPILATESLSEGDFSSGSDTSILGHVLNHQKVSQTEGDFLGTLSDGDTFGRSISVVGDIDGDQVDDLVVGAPFSDDGANSAGSVWILFLEADGTVKAQQKISASAGGFTGVLDEQDTFGASVAGLGDVDGDGTPDIAVGAIGDDDGVSQAGAVWILFLHPNGTVKGHQKISASSGGFTGHLDVFDFLGTSMASLGDLDRDGVVDLAVGAVLDDDGGENRGAVWILFLKADGTVKSHSKVSDTEGGFGGALDDGDRLGSSISPLRIYGSSGSITLAVGATLDDDGGTDRGAVWVLSLSSQGTVSSHWKISETSGGFTGVLENGDWFGNGVANLGDLNCDGVVDLAVGAPNGGFGAVWILFLGPGESVQLHQKIDHANGSFTGELELDDQLGWATAALGDLDGDGNVDLSVGARLDDDGGADRGAVWNLFLDGGGCFHDELFSDGFEAGDASAWSGVSP